VPTQYAAFLNRLSCDVANGTNRPTIRAAGFAREANDVLKWQDRLLTNGDRYDLQPHSIEPQSRDPDYPARFEIEAIVKTPAP